MTTSLQSPAVYSHTCDLCSREWQDDNQTLPHLPGFLLEEPLSRAKFGLCAVCHNGIRAFVANKLAVNLARNQALVDEYGPDAVTNGITPIVAPPFTHVPYPTI